MPCNPQVIIKVAVTLMLLGANNIWADTGDVAATYRADTKRYIDAKIAKAIEEAMQG